MLRLSEVPQERQPQPDQWQPGKDWQEEREAADLVAECRQAVSREVGRWGSGRTTRSDYERDALLQTVLTRVYADPLLLHRLLLAERPARVLTLRRDVRDLLRDSRGHLDSIDGWKPRADNTVWDRTEHKRSARKRPTVCQSIADQAAAMRDADERAPVARLTSLEALAERHTDEDGQTDWLAVAGDQARERDTEEPLPAVALAEHSRELAAAMVLALADRWQLTPRDQERLTVALLIASGESVADLTLAGCGTVDQVKKRAAQGRKILASRAIDPAELVRVRRQAVADLGLAEPEPEPDARDLLAADALRAVETCQRQERDWLRARQAGSGQSTRASGRQPTGPAADVLEYIARMDALLTRPAFTLDTASGQPQPNGWQGHGQRWQAPATSQPLACWQPQPTSPTRAADPNVTDTARHHWPDRITGGQPHYSPQHPASRREAFPQTAAAADRPLTGQRCHLSPEWHQTNG